MKKTNGTKVKSEFFKITSISPLHPTNRLNDKIVRKDLVFNALADRVFDFPELLYLLSKKIKTWLSIDDSEFVYSLAGYIYYLREDFKTAKLYFLKALERNPQNLDNWFDLAFSLYHLGGKDEKLAKDIFFNFNRYVKTYSSKKKFRIDS